MSLKDNDMCKCGSGKLYKDCHKIRDRYKPHKLLQFDKQNYINKWEKDSNYFSRNGYYDWMADILFKHINPKNILDFGCGNGNGILALLKNNDIENIISIEENNVCIKAAQENIEKAGFIVDTIFRNNPVIDKKNGIYINKFKPIVIKHSAKVTIIEGEVLYDTLLTEYLKSFKFDAITCWLLGTHESMQNNIEMLQHGITSNNKNYRLYIQNRIYELADEILNKNGVLHIVDRGETPYNQELQDIVRQSHIEQASVTTLNVLPIDWLPYNPLADGIPMICSTVKMDTRKSQPKGNAFLSAISIK